MCLWRQRVIMARQADHEEIAELTGRGAGLSDAWAKRADSHHTSTPCNDRSAVLCAQDAPWRGDIPKEKGSMRFQGTVYESSLLFYFWILWWASVGCLCVKCPNFLSPHISLGYFFFSPSFCLPLYFPFSLLQKNKKKIFLKTWPQSKPNRNNTKNQLHI